MGPQNNYIVPSEDRSQITITPITIMKKFEILGELPKCETETQSEQMLLEEWRP